MYKILIVDDEANTRKILQKYGEFEGFQTAEASDGMEAIDLIKREKFDLVIMDVMMPELDGFSTVREIRKNSSIPIIMLSARGDAYDKIHGFEIGIDDYVTKPFVPKELMLRIQAVLNRFNSRGDIKSETFETDKLKVDFAARIIYINKERVELSPKEYDLLFFMVKNRGIALSREKILSEIWGYDYYGDDRTLDTHIKLLRRSLGECAEYIVTVRGVGYRFEG